MQVMEGVVTVVQESRFQLMDDAGVYHHFLLSHAAACEPSELIPLQHRQARIRVCYRDASNLIAKVAHRIDVFDEAAAS